MTQIEADAKKNGMTVVEVTVAELAEWQKVAQPLIDGYLETTSDAGKKILDSLGAN